MAELRIYHGRPANVEPPRSLIRDAIETASAQTPSPEFCVGEVVHHQRVEDWRVDFDRTTGGQSVATLCNPSDGSNIEVSNVSQSTVDTIEQELRNRLGNGMLTLMRVDKSYRIDKNGSPRALPEELTVDETQL